MNIRAIVVFYPIDNDDYNQKRLELFERLEELGKVTELEQSSSPNIGSHVRFEIRFPKENADDIKSIIKKNADYQIEDEWED